MLTHSYCSCNSQRFLYIIICAFSDPLSSYVCVRFTFDSFICLFLFYVQVNLQTFLNRFVLCTFDVRHSHIGTAKSEFKFSHLNTLLKTLIQFKKKKNTDRIEFYYFVNIHRNRYQTDLPILACVRVDRDQFKRRSDDYTCLPRRGFILETIIRHHRGLGNKSTK